MRSKSVGGFQDGEERTFPRRFVVVVPDFRTLEREVEPRHVPADRDDLIVRHLQPPAQKTNHRLLPVPERELRIINTVGVILLSLSILVLAKLLHLLVDFRLADVMQKRHDGDAVRRKPRGDVRLQSQLRITHEHRLVIDVQRMLQQSPG